MKRVALLFGALWFILLMGIIRPWDFSNVAVVASQLEDR